LVPGATVGLDFGNMVTAEVASAPRFRDEAGRDMFDNQTARNLFFHDCDDDLAAWASVNRETVTRALGRLREEALIATGRGWIEVLDRDGLLRRAAD